MSMQRLFILMLAGLLLRHAAVHAHPGAGIALDPQGRIFFTAGPMVILIETNGAARTLIHDQKHQHFYQLHHLQRTPRGMWVTASDMGTGLWQFSIEGKLTRFYPPPNEDRALQIGLGGDPFAVDQEGNFYAVNSAQNRFTQILKVDGRGQIRVLAGGDWGFADGQGTHARFGDLHSSSMLALSNGTLLVTDGGRAVRKVSREGVVTTVAGGREPGYAEGPGTAARFLGARGLAVDGDGSIFVADDGGGEQGGRIRRISPDGVVSTFAGSGKSRASDGPAATASFSGPTGLAFAPNGDLLVLEPDEPRVRRISSGSVTTILRGLP